MSLGEVPPDSADLSLDVDHQVPCETLEWLYEEPQNAQGTANQCRNLLEMEAGGTKALAAQSPIQFLTVEERRLELAELMLTDSSIPRRRTHLGATGHHLGEYYLHFLPSDNEPNGIPRFMAEFNGVTEILEDPRQNESPLPLLRLYASRQSDRVDLSEAAVIAGHMYGEHASPANGDKRLNQCIHQWYSTTLDHLNGALLSAREYFRVMRLRTGCRDGEIYTSFLADLEKEMEDLFLSTLNMALVFGIHAQLEDCAVYMGLSSHHVPRGEQMKDAGVRWRRLMHSPIYAKGYAHDAYRGTQPPQNCTVQIPTFISAVDIEDFSKALQEFWASMLTSFKTRREDRKMRYVFRSYPEDDAQARIGMELQKGRFAGFCLRIDLENRDGKPRLAIDIGRVKWDKAIENAEWIAENASDDVVMKYSETLDATGAHAYMIDRSIEHPRVKQVMYPSVMRAPGLSIDQRIALIASVIMQQGRDIDLYDGEIFGYHNRSKRLDIEDYKANFAQIVQRMSMGCR